MIPDPAIKAMPATISFLVFGGVAFHSPVRIPIEVMVAVKQGNCEI
jgi:hypothetical protein